MYYYVPNTEIFVREKREKITHGATISLKS